jgi:hypothetical protein
MYIMTPEPVSTAYYINPSHQTEKLEGVAIKKPDYF